MNARDSGFVNNGSETESVVSFGRDADAIIAGSCGTSAAIDSLSGIRTLASFTEKLVCYFEFLHDGTQLFENLLLGGLMGKSQLRRFVIDVVSLQLSRPAIQREVLDVIREDPAMSRMFQQLAQHNVSTTVLGPV